MAVKRIICIGNRLDARDAAGARVYDRLARIRLPHDVEVIDGGLAGLDLLRFVEEAERVVFVDAVIGLEPTPGVVVLAVEEAARRAAAATPYDHATGFSYLLQALPHLYEGKIPDVYLVGVEGPPDEKTLAKAAEISLEIAVRGPEGAKSATGRCVGAAF